MLRPLLALALLPLTSASASPADMAEPYRILQQANIALDPALAASAYASGAKLVFDYPGRAGETFEGRDEIRSSYMRTFGQVDAGSGIGLHFRFEPPGLVSDQHSGVYRIDATAGGRPTTVYGRFTVKLINENGAWRFAEDRGSVATAADFEKLADTGLDDR